MVRARIGLALALFGIVSCAGGGRAPQAAVQDGTYVPQAVYCYQPPSGTQPASPLCSTIPGNIGDDPALSQKIAYNGIAGNRPTSLQNDPQTPFDNLSWQTFVALNWTAGKEREPAQEGLGSDGARVWERWARVSDVFGNAPVRASCTIPPALRVFQIGSNGKGEPVGQNEEYIQAATGDPLIDVSGNWTIYERRLNGVDVAYLEAPGGNASFNLTTIAGQRRLIAAGVPVDFPAAGGANATGAIEIKAAWRVLDPADRVANDKKYYVVSAMLTVAPDLVVQPAGTPPAPICARVDLGLVGMHIIQKNPVTDNSLFPQWFWSTFEHVDNTPLAQAACDPASPENCTTLGRLSCAARPDPQVSYAYFTQACPGCPTNQPPAESSRAPTFGWSPTQPFAGPYMVTTRVSGKPVTVGTQVSRCWNIYALTRDLNTQWRGQLRAVGSVFQNYMLVGTQWGADTTATPNPKIPSQVVPNFLSNSLIETYLQTKANPKDPFGNGSCVTCHKAATLLAGDGTTSSNFSFVTQLARPGLVRRPPIPPSAQ